MQTQTLTPLFPCIETWSWFSAEKGLNFNGHWVSEGDQRVLIDPPPMPEACRLQVAAQPITAILLTNRDHVREAMDWRIRANVPIWAPAPDAMAMDFVTLDVAYNDGDALPCGLRAVGLSDGKSPGETALYLDRFGGLFIVGDALIGNPPGAFSLLPAEKYADVKKAAAGLKRLLDFPFDAVLVGDGVSLLTGARAAVVRCIDHYRPDET